MSTISSKQIQLKLIFLNKFELRDTSVKFTSGKILFPDEESPY